MRKLWGVWGVLDVLGFFLRSAMRLGIRILAGIPLFWAVAPVRILAWVNYGWFWVLFDHGRRRGGYWGDLVILF